MDFKDRFIFRFSWYGKSLNPRALRQSPPSEEEVEEYIVHCPILKMYNVLKRACLAVGNMSVIIVCVLLEEAHGTSFSWLTRRRLPSLQFTMPSKDCTLYSVHYPQWKSYSDSQWRDTLYTWWSEWIPPRAQYDLYLYKEDNPVRLHIYKYYPG